MIWGYHYFRKHPYLTQWSVLSIHGGSISEWKNNRVKQACTMSWWGKSMINFILEVVETEFCHERCTCHLILVAPGMDTNGCPNSLNYCWWREIRRSPLDMEKYPMKTYKVLYIQTLVFSARFLVAIKQYEEQKTPEISHRYCTKNGHI